MGRHGPGGRVNVLLGKGPHSSFRSSRPGLGASGLRPQGRDGSPDSDARSEGTFCCRSQRKATCNLQTATAAAPTRTHGARGHRSCGCWHTTVALAGAGPSARFPAGPPQSTPDPCPPPPTHPGQEARESPSGQAPDAVSSQLKTALTWPSTWATAEGPYDHCPGRTGGRGPPQPQPRELPGRAVVATLGLVPPHGRPAFAVDRGASCHVNPRARPWG